MRADMFSDHYATSCLSEKERKEDKQTKPLEAKLLVLVCAMWMLSVPPFRFPVIW